MAAPAMAAEPVPAEVVAAVAVAVAAQPVLSMAKKRDKRKAKSQHKMGASRSAQPTKWLRKKRQQSPTKY